jgi:hypothetical protein
LSRTTPTNEQFVWYALGQLNPLLQEAIVLPADIAGLSRRQFLKRAGLLAGAVTVPVVVSLVAPTPAHAQSTTLVCCDCENEEFTFVADCTLCTTFCADKGGVFFCGALCGSA